MMKNNRFAYLVLISLLLARGPRAAAADPSWPRFHGPQGDNTSRETGLAAQWPEQGPRLVWTARGIGRGFAGVTIAGGRIYTAGDVGNELVIFALDMDGRIQWRAVNGAAWKESGPTGARATPTIDGQRLYHENAHDQVVCLDARTGRKVWGVDLAAQLRGQRDGFGRAESLLIDGGRVICCPGGATAVAALDKHTGRTVWKSPTAGEPAGYASPILAECRGLRMILTMASRSLVGVDADNGRLLWRFEHYSPRYVANCVSPIYHDGRIFISGGYGVGSVLLAIDLKGAKPALEPVWRVKDLDNRHGGVILLEGRAYGASHFSKHGQWLSLDWKTGRTLHAERGVGEGSLTCAGGLLYTLSESRNLGLVQPTSAGFRLISRFTIPEGGEGPSWAHPVVCGRRLYIRHGEFLYAYDVGAGK
jgi:outer membrane protein assembly factor BamB